jgi:hypothetical protein
LTVKNSTDESDFDENWLQGWTKKVERRLIKQVIRSWTCNIWLLGLY